MKLDTLLNKATKPESHIRSKVVTVTPEFATETLSNFNNSNRRMSRSLAKLYANEMLRGKWETNGEPIIFSVDDKQTEHLISGQHRLAALSFANDEFIKDPAAWPDAQLEFDTVIIFGVAHTTADTVDTGKARSHADVLFRDEWIDSVIPAAWNNTVNRRSQWTKCLAGAARLVWLIDGGAQVSSAPKFLISEMLEFLKTKHPDLGVFVTLVLEANDGADNTGLKMSLPYIAALSYVASIDLCDNGDGTETAVIDNAYEERFHTFITTLASGAGLVKGSPEWALAGYWNKIGSEVGSKDRDTEWVAPYVKAATAMLAEEDGLKVSDISLSAKEKTNYKDFPILFDGYHTLMFERAAAAKAAAKQAKLDAALAANEPAEDAPDIDDQPVQEFTAPEPEVKPTRPSRPSKKKSAAKSATKTAAKS